MISDTPVSYKLKYISLVDVDILSERHRCRNVDDRCETGPPKPTKSAGTRTKYNSVHKQTLFRVSPTLLIGRSLFGSQSDRLGTGETMVPLITREPGVMFRIR